MRLLLLAVLTSCGHPSPLGTFAEKEWAKDCETPIVKEDPHDPSAPGPIMLDGGPAFSQATRRYRCPPPGWALYTDDRDRIVGLCVDDDNRPNRPGRPAHGSISETVDHETDRARRLITARWGHRLAADMLKGADGDRCSPDSEPVAHGMVRWGQTQFFYPSADGLSIENVHSLNMCCWQVK